MMTILQVMVGEPQKFPLEEAVNITNFNSHEGLYYQYVGTMKTSNSEWKLINYLDLDNYSSELYHSTSQLCGEIRQKLESNDSIYICQLFSQATLPYLYEIEINHQNILSTIGQSVDTNDRFRRGLRNAISRLASVLYGNIENIDMEFIFSKIKQLTQTNTKKYELGTRTNTDDSNEAYGKQQYIVKSINKSTKVTGEQSSLKRPSQKKHTKD